MDQAEASGKTVDDALNKALAKLGASRDEVEFVVLDEGRKGGLFGRGAKEAVVRVERTAGARPQPESARQTGTRIPRGGQRGPRRDSGGPGASPSAERPRDERPDRGTRGSRPGGPARPQSRTGFDSAIPKLTDADFLRKPNFEEGAEGTPPPAAAGRERGGRGGRSTPEPRAPRSDQPDQPRTEQPDRPRGERPERSERRHRDDEPPIAPDINAAEVDVAAQTVDDILRILDIPAELSIREPLTPGDGLGSVLAVIDIKGNDLGLLIGRRGETLLSLQYLVNLILAKRFPGRGGVTLDVEHYRHRREEQVISLARRMADRVRETGSPITLEPMTASERRLIHILFAEDQQLETNSVGEGDNRKVVISARQ